MQDVDELSSSEARPTLEMPEILRNLSELVSRAMAICRSPSHAADLELAAIEITVRILTHVINAVEVRDIQQNQAHLGRRLSLDRAERERWD